MNKLIHNKANTYTGWLGNKMFQIASTIGIAQKNGLVPLFPPHEYINYFAGPIPTGQVGNYNTIEYKEKSIKYEDIRLDPAKHHDLKGYFQSYRYFEHCADHIKKVFEFRENIRKYVAQKYRDVLMQGGQSNLVMVHVRRGDYMNIKQNHVCLSETDYYIDAIGYIKQKVDRPIFIVFSDDTEWCRRYFKGNNVFFAEGNNEVQDSCFMTMCDHAIIANSSKSWWGAWLMIGKNKIVIAPKQWWGPEYLKFGWDTQDLIPSEWVQM